MKYQHIFCRLRIRNNVCIFPISRRSAAAGSLSDDARVGERLLIRDLSNTDGDEQLHLLVARRSVCAGWSYHTTIYLIPWPCSIADVYDAFATKS